MARRQQYTSVVDVLRDMAPDSTFPAEVEERIADRRLIKHLVALRAAKGLSQQDVAEVLDCTQGNISKLENAKDADLRLGDLRAYADALGCQLVACPVPRDMKPTDKVKCHAFSIKKHMDDMAQLAKLDDNIAEGVGKFFFELFVNFTRMLGDSAKHLPRRADGPPLFDVEFNFLHVCNDLPPRKRCLKAESKDVVEAAP